CIGAFLHSRPDLFNTPMQLTRPAAVSEYFVNTKETVPEPKPARSSVNFRPVCFERWGNVVGLNLTCFHILFHQFSLEVRPEPLVRLNQLQSDYAPDTIDL